MPYIPPVTEWAKHTWISMETPPDDGQRALVFEPGADEEYTVQIFNAEFFEFGPVWCRKIDGRLDKIVCTDGVEKWMIIEGVE